MKITISRDKDGLFTKDYIFTESGDIDENKFLRRELKRAGIEPPAIGKEITVDLVLVARREQK